jgi:hypothetical protein
MSLNPFAEPPVSGANSSTKTLTYGAALNAKQPVYMQADGKVYPIVGSGGTLTGSVPTTFFGGQAESSCLTPVNGTPNRFLWSIAWTDGTLYQQVYDVNPTNGTLAFTAFSSLTGTITSAIANEGHSTVLNQTSTKGLLAYTTAAGLTFAPLAISAGGSVFGVGSSTNIAGSAPSPIIVNRPNAHKFLVSFRGASNHIVALLDTTGVITYTQLASNTLNGSSVRSTAIAKLDGVNKYVWITSQVGSITIQPFIFDPTLNTYTTLGAGATYVNAGAGGMTFDVVYRDAVEAWIVINRDSANTQISTHKIDITTGVVTNFAPAVFSGADVIANALRTLVTGHRLSSGKFLVSWFASGTPSQAKTAEFTLDRITGAFSVSLAGILNSVLLAAPSQGRGFGENTSGLGYGFRNFGLSTTQNQVQSFGTFTTATPAVLMLGMNQLSGSLNAVGTVDLIGSISTGHVGLTPGSVYYADLVTGGITLNSASGVIAGRALSTTELQVMNN